MMAGQGEGEERRGESAWQHIRCLNLPSYQNIYEHELHVCEEGGREGESKLHTT